MGRVIAVGKFDGLHIAHRLLLRRGREIAREGGLDFLVCTFRQSRDALLPNAIKERLLRREADEVEALDFEAVRDLPAGDFLEWLRVERDLQALVMGPGHRFGRDREGDPRFALEWGETRGIRVEVLPPITAGPVPISSRYIRERLREGDVKGAARLLGRQPLLYGRPVAGTGLGRKLGFPTVNLELAPELLRPKAGVYLAWAFWEEGDGVGLFYLGERPTFPELPPAAELHLFRPPCPDPRGEVEVHLLAYLREDRAFPGPEALRAQIAQDVQRGKALLAGSARPRSLLFG